LTKTYDLLIYKNTNTHLELQNTRRNKNRTLLFDGHYCKWPETPTQSKSHVTWFPGEVSHR